MKQVFGGLAVALLLAGCEMKNQEPVGVQTDVSFQCRLLQSAADSVLPSERSLKRSILSGCPGRYENRKRSEGEQRQFSAVLAANPAPVSLIERGLGFERAYNRLVILGVPARLALGLVDTEDYKNFANQLNS